MKLRVESDGASKTEFGEPFIRPTITNKAVLLNLTLEKQQLENWCEAAIAMCLSNYYGTESFDQAQVVGKVLEVDCSTYQQDPVVQKHCNQNSSLNLALTAIGCYSHWSLGKPSLERLRFEMNQGRPICLRVEWYQGGAHPY